MSKTETIICNNRNGCIETVIAHNVLTEQGICCVVLKLIMRFEIIRELDERCQAIRIVAKLMRAY